MQQRGRGAPTCVPRAQIPSALTLSVAQSWDGHPLLECQRATVEVCRGREGFSLRVDAPWAREPPPNAPPGPTPRLWEHEVVELFLVGRGAHYLELELGPYGHHLALELKGVRRPVRELLPLQLNARRDPTLRRWAATARVPDHLGEPVLALNAFAIRRSQGLFCAHRAVPGPAPDFHQLQHYRQLPGPL